MTRARSAGLKAAFTALRKAALSCPEAWEDFPWGDQAFKVGKKVFAFIEGDDRCLQLTLKLPESGSVALGLPFVEPTGYGLGKSGWVNARFERGDDVPVPMLLEWLHESYGAVAPKKLAQQLGGLHATTRRREPPKAAASRRAPAGGRGPRAGTSR
jgi:predicted DNA-binding protein (MmcQ/YjbR family)